MISEMNLISVIQQLPKEDIDVVQGYVEMLEDEIEAAKQVAERHLKKEIQLKKQLDYLRSGEYLNQLRFERDMLQHVVDNGEVSKVDKEFIDMTHRNTELLEENQELEKQLEEIKNEPLTNRIGRIDSIVANIYSRNRTQQKEFIEWLRNESKELIRDAGYHQRICLEILSKYKEIIGIKNE